VRFFACSAVSLQRSMILRRGNCCLCLVAFVFFPSVLPALHVAVARADEDSRVERRALSEEGQFASLVHRVEASLTTLRRAEAASPDAVSLASLRGSSQDNDRQNALIAVISSSLGYVFLATIGAVIYVNLLQPKLTPETDMIVQKESEGFEYGLVSFENCDPRLCLCSVFCLCIRWPETVSNERIGLIGFWPAFFLFTFLQGFTGIFFGLLWLIWLYVMVSHRQRIRQHYGLPWGGAGSVVQDCFLWAFCCCLAGAQEARQVEHVQTAVLRSA